MDKKTKQKNIRKPKSDKNARFFVSFLRRSLLILFLIGILFGFWVLKNPRFFPIKKVAVAATYQNVNRQTLKNTITPYLTQSFFALHINELKNNLLKIPWVSEVTIRRIWPDKLQVIIGEQETAARWNANSFININGELFTPPKIFNSASLPLLTGRDDQKDMVWQYYLAANKYLQPLTLRVTRMDLLPSLNLRILLSNGVLVMLTSDNFDNNIKTFIKVYPKITKDRDDKIESIDFRYRNGFAVKREK